MSARAIIHLFSFHQSNLSTFHILWTTQRYLIPTRTTNQGEGGFLPALEIPTDSDRPKINIKVALRELRELKKIWKDGEKLPTQYSSQFT